MKSPDSVPQPLPSEELIFFVFAFLPRTDRPVSFEVHGAIDEQNAYETILRNGWHIDVIARVEVFGITQKGVIGGAEETDGRGRSAA